MTRGDELLFRRAARVRATSERIMADGKKTSTGVLFALCSIFTVQIGAAASTPVFAAIGPAGTAWLRLC
ncbi:MAG: hypothetical protein ACXWLG_11290, partial [Myxococcaceae bacterium]